MERTGTFQWTVPVRSFDRWFFLRNRGGRMAMSFKGGHLNTLFNPYVV
jgi:hypothetical protein